MAAKNLYPRATVKKIVKAHSRRPLSKNVDILVRRRTAQTKPVMRANSPQIFLNYLMFLQE
jgi:hypothetical protein